MIANEISRNRQMQAAMAALAIAFLIFIWSLVSAIHIEPTADAPLPAFNTTASNPRVIAPERSQVAEVVDLNIFAPDRTAPLRRYSLGGDEEVLQAETLEEIPKPVVHGTAVGTGSRSFAMASLNGAPTVIVRVGDKLGEYTVRSIERGVVVFSTASGERFAVDANPS